MKRYVVSIAFSVLEKKLFIPGDELYAELIRDMIHIYDIKTRRYLGKVSKVTTEHKLLEVAYITPTF